MNRDGVKVTPSPVCDVPDLRKTCFFAMYSGVSVL